MIKRNDIDNPGFPWEEEKCIPLPKMECGPIYANFQCVTSVNGLTGDVLLRSLTAGDKVYNASSDIEITAEDLGLKTALKYLGKRSKKQIEEEEDVRPGDMYFCTTDNFFYVAITEEIWEKLASSYNFEELRKDVDYLLQEVGSLAPIAKTANVNDLVQDLDDYVVLDCSVTIS